MRTSTFVICNAAVLLMSIWLPTAHADGAAEAAFEEGRVALAQADFEVAYRSYVRASELDPGNEGYREEAALLRRVIMVRERLPRLNELEQWSAAARSLHTYYFDRGVYKEALTLDRELLKRVDQADSAVLLAQTLLQLDQNAEAAEVLEPWTGKDGDDHARVLCGLALARQGEHEAAQGLADQVKLTKDCSPALALDLSRLRVQLKETQGALEALRHCLRSTPPSQLERQQTRIRECTDLAALDGSDAFAEALQTPSEVKESSCSSGSSCGKCPNRSKCSGDKATEKKEEGRQP
jgi:tetratricopeptide (TPR) repeat protein